MLSAIFPRTRRCKSWPSTSASASPRSLDGVDRPAIVEPLEPEREPAGGAERVPAGGHDDVLTSPSHLGLVAGDIDAVHLQDQPVAPRLLEHVAMTRQLVGADPGP